MKASEWQIIERQSRRHATGWQVIGSVGSIIVDLIALSPEIMVNWNFVRDVLAVKEILRWLWTIGWGRSGRCAWWIGRRTPIGPNHPGSRLVPTLSQHQ